MNGRTEASFLGTGWRFPVQPDEGGGIALSSGLASIEESIRIILSTSPGEREHRPAFGCRIADLAFRTNDGRTRALARYHVEEALARWEPRIRDVRVEAVPGGRDEVRLEVTYLVRSTNHPGNLVHPFHLRPGPGTGGAP